MLRRGREELHLDAVWTSDDIGTQTAPFFSPKIFREFFKPYYQELVAYAHELGMHFWLHCCGNILAFLPDLIEIGVDVLHRSRSTPMDEREVAQKYGKDLCIWAGFDVQRIIPYGTPEDVRRGGALPAGYLCPAGGAADPGGGQQHDAGHPDGEPGGAAGRGPALWRRGLQKVPLSDKKRPKGGKPLPGAIFLPGF